jgi:hypothetical protein
VINSPAFLVRLPPSESPAANEHGSRLRRSALGFLIRLNQCTRRLDLGSLGFKQGLSVLSYTRYTRQRWAPRGRTHHDALQPGAAMADRFFPNDMAAHAQDGVEPSHVGSRHDVSSSLHGLLSLLYAAAPSPTASSTPPTPVLEVGCNSRALAGLPT